jgi:hypothetical protein
VAEIGSAHDLIERQIAANASRGARAPSNGKRPENGFQRRG